MNSDGFLLERILLEAQKKYDDEYINHLEKINKQQKHDKERITHLNEMILKDMERIEKLEEHKNRQIDENRKLSRRIDELEKQDVFLLNSILEVKSWLTTSDLLRRIEKEKYEDNQLCSSAVNKDKTTGLSFEEAIKILSSGGKITRKKIDDYFFIENSENNDLIFSLNDVLSNDWEVFE